METYSPTNAVARINPRRKGSSEETLSLEIPSYIDHFKKILSACEETFHFKCLAKGAAREHVSVQRLSQYPQMESLLTLKQTKPFKPLYPLTCKISRLIFLHFLKDLVEIADKRPKHFPFGDYFTTSHNLFFW